jgi:hypothetical protein
MGAHMWPRRCVHHRTGPLLPPDGDAPKLIQLYIYDTENEVSNRLGRLSGADATDGSLQPSIVHQLMEMLDRYNPFVKKFRTARETTRSPDEKFIIRIDAKEGDPVQYNLPTTDDLAMLVVGDFTIETFKRDIIIETRNKELKRISALHPAYMPLQYPLLFPFGERGFQVGALYNGILNRDSGERKRVQMTMQDYYCYQFHYKPDQPNPFLSYGVLSSQAKVDACACIDENRLSYILNNQRKKNYIQKISKA